jgi:predicted aconitase
VRPDDLRRTRDLLTTAVGSDLATVSLGHRTTRSLRSAASSRHSPAATWHPAVDVYISTGRGVLDEVEDRGWAEGLRCRRLTIVTDTCTYVTPILRETSRPAMTDSAKWAYYAPGNLGVDVVLASTQECVESAVAGKVVPGRCDLDRRSLRWLSHRRSRSQVVFGSGRRRGGCTSTNRSASGRPRFCER